MSLEDLTANSAHPLQPLIGIATDAFQNFYLDLERADFPQT